MRRLPTLAVALAAIGLVLGLVSPAAAQDAPSAPSSSSAGFVDVVKVSGLLDPVLVDFVEQSVHDAERNGAVALVLQVNSTGAVVSDTRLVQLLSTIASASVPVDVWIGPSGSELTGTSAQLAGVTDVLGMAPGTKIGDAGELVGVDTTNQRLDLIRDRTLSTQEANDLGVTSFPAPTIGDFIVNLPGVETREVPGEGDQTRREPVTQVRFGQLSLLSQLMHTVASPAVAYLLFVVGMALMVFELFTAGVGVAGVVGAGSFVLGCYGLAVLPTHWWGVALLVASMVAFSVDVQTGVPRVWTGIGVVAFVLGSLTLYDGVSLSWITLLVAVVGVLLTFLAGMPSMVRTRFSTPAIGREWMVGETGRAVTAVDPDGVVQIREALWRASADRATPVEELDRVRVVGVEGLVLEVEPAPGVETPDGK